MKINLSIGQIKLNEIRKVKETAFTLKEKILKIFAFILLGSIMGFGAKQLDGISLMGEVLTCLGIWVFLATIIGAYSRSPKAAGIHVFIFFVAMLVSYYLCSMKLFGFFPTYYFLRWMALAFLTPLFAYMIWYSRGSGWIAAFCAAIPMSILLLEGFSFIYTASIPQGLDLLLATTLLANLCDTREQKNRAILFVILLFLLLLKINFTSLLFGGL